MKENKTRKPYVKPSMEVIKVETTSILAGSTYSDPWGNGGEVDIELEEINQ